MEHLTGLDKFLLFRRKESDFSSDSDLSANSYASFSGTLGTVTNGGLRKLQKDEGIEHIYIFPAQHKKENVSSQHFKQSTLFAVVICLATTQERCK